MVVALWTVVVVVASVVVAPFVAAAVSGTVVLSALVGGEVEVSVTDEVSVFALWWPEEAGAEVGGAEADFELNMEQPASRTIASSHIRRDTALCISDGGLVAHGGTGLAEESGRPSGRRVQICLGEPVPKAPVQVFGSAQVGDVEVATVILDWLPGDPRVLNSTR